MTCDMDEGEGGGGRGTGGGGGREGWRRKEREGGRKMRKMRKMMERGVQYQTGSPLFPCQPPLHQLLLLRHRLPIKCTLHVAGAPHTHASRVVTHPVSPQGPPSCQGCQGG